MIDVLLPLLATFLKIALFIVGLVYITTVACIIMFPEKRRDR